MSVASLGAEEMGEERRVHHPRGRRTYDLQAVTGMNPQPTDSGLFAGMPWWVRGFTLIGAPVVLAGYLIYDKVERQSAQVERQSDAIVEQTKVLANVVTLLSDISRDHDTARAQTEQMIRVLRVSCTEQAKSSNARIECQR